MRYYIIIFMLFISTSAFGQSPYDTTQDDRFYNYVLADSSLAGELSTKVNWVIGILSAIGLGVLGILFALVKKHIGLKVLIIGSLITLSSAVPLKDAECAGGCVERPCRVDTDCPTECYCDGYYFNCLPR